MLGVWDGLRDNYPRLDSLQYSPQAARVRYFHLQASLSRLMSPNGHISRSQIDQPGLNNSARSGYVLHTCLPYMGPRLSSREQICSWPVACTPSLDESCHSTGSDRCGGDNARFS